MTIDISYLEEIKDEYLLDVLNRKMLSDERGKEEKENSGRSWLNLSSEEKLEVVIAKLSFAVPKGASVNIVPDQNINGYTNGTDIWVTSRAVEYLDEGELAALIAHELSHIATYDVKAIETLIDTGVGSARKVWKSKDVGVVGKTAVSVVRLGSTLVGSRLLRQALELKADRQAVSFLEEAGYSSSDMHRLLSRLKGSGGLLSTHPSVSLRRKMVSRI